MAYLFNTDRERQAMLRTIGAGSIGEILEQIPAALQLRRPLDLPPPLTELDLERQLRALAAENVGVGSRVCFLGGGAYDHYIPAVVDEITGRGEFYTAYTPYQAEASQGSLQAFFEYQSLICELTGMDVSNASLYDGASAVAEAVLMSLRTTDRVSKVVISAAVHPEYLQVVQTYVSHLGCDVVVVPITDGVTDLAKLAAVVDDRTAAVVAASPNFFGCLEDVAAISELAHKHGAMSVQIFDPISLGLVRRPGDLGVDIAVAEGQPLGIPLQFGGPYLGILACREEFVRKLPGRLIGQTVDRLGRTCYVLNLQAREQHIRRDKATSNICTNQGLMALRATVYMSLLGPQGLREVATACCQLAHYAHDQLLKVPGVSALGTRPFFKEFGVRAAGGAERAMARAAKAGLDVGPALSRFPRIAGLSADEQSQGLLVAVTECRSRDDIDRLCRALAAS
ncbi:MAG: aminomethyl-transferring glycine dehydrogenase subunit GcvPA [Planctomycetaceae bacterium]|nr:aminomethyl-transferring glycine dehydrogenase subunit GcvPA [Planctomycetaceae bacterium]